MVEKEQAISEKNMSRRFTMLKNHIRVDCELFTEDVPWKSSDLLVKNCKDSSNTKFTDVSRKCTPIKSLRS